jgi:hypothetical protein
MIPLLFLISLATPATATNLADSMPLTNRNFHTTIVTNAAKNQTGYLYGIDDSTISITKMYLSKKSLTSGSVHARTYKYADINYVRMKRHNSVGRGALIGGLIGIGAGIAAGFIEGDDKPDPDAWISFNYTAEQKAIGYGVLLGITGTLIGLIIGAVAHKKFTINGNREKFHAMKTDLLHRANKTPAN